MTADPIRQQVVDLYRRRYKTAHYTAKVTGLTVDEVLEIAGVTPQPEMERPRRVPAPAKPKQERAPQAGCGCTEKKLCGPHKERLDRARAKA